MFHFSQKLRRNVLSCRIYDVGLPHWAVSGFESVASNIKLLCNGQVIWMLCFP